MAKAKMKYSTAIKMFKSEIAEVKKEVEERGFKSDWVDAKPKITERTTFLEAGTKSKPSVQHSECRYYKGYYVNSAFGAVGCSLVESAMPGVIYDIICSKTKEECENCPVNANQGLALRQAEESFVNSFAVKTRNKNKEDKLSEQNKN